MRQGNLKLRATAFFLVALLTASLLVGRAHAGPPSPPPSGPPLGAMQPMLLGIQARNIVNSLQIGSSSRFRVKDPAELRAKGLRGINAGDEVEVKNLGDGELRITDPTTRESITVKQ